jgi:hypothetical protein
MFLTPAIVTALVLAGLAVHLQARPKRSRVLAPAPRRQPKADR